jgi:hypothetical protein
MMVLLSVNLTFASAFLHSALKSKRLFFSSYSRHGYYNNVRREGRRLRKGWKRGGRWKGREQKLEGGVKAHQPTCVLIHSYRDKAVVDLLGEEGIGSFCKSFTCSGNLVDGGGEASGDSSELASLLLEQFQVTRLPFSELLHCLTEQLVMLFKHPREEGKSPGMSRPLINIPYNVATVTEDSLPPAQLQTILLREDFTQSPNVHTVTTQTL